MDNMGSADENEHFYNFYWNIIDLQCCVSFRYTTKWLSYADTHIHSLLDSSPI